MPSNICGNLGGKLLRQAEIPGLFWKMINSGPTGGKLTSWGRRGTGGGQKVRMPGREVEDNGVSTGRVRPSGCSSVLQTTWNLFSLKLTTQECNLAFFETFCSAFIPPFSHCGVGIDARVRTVALMTYFLVEGVGPEHGGEQSSVFEGSLQAMSANLDAPSPASIYFR